LTRNLLACLAVAAASWGEVAGAGGDAAAALGGKYTALAEGLVGNPFRRPLILDSAESTQELAGDIYARVDHPLAEVSAALAKPENWCDVLILHINIKHCRASAASASSLLAVSIGKKYDQPLGEAYRIEFAHRVVAATPEYLEVELTAERGPLGTSNYRIRLQALALDGGRTFLHFAYAYSFGLAGRLAMEAYLATAARDKVGFTVIGSQPDGQPEVVRGVRGVVERNNMRYFLAIDAYLGAAGGAPNERVEKRLQAWFDATEKYPRQLHEIDRAAYLEMKRAEVLRQKTLP
jgi:hypothetical protein